MAVFAKICRGHVGALFSGSFAAIVAAGATTDDPAVVEIGAQPGRSKVAVTAFERCRDMAFGLARCLRAVVANDAVACDGERDLRMIHSLGRIPAHHRVAGIAVLAGRWVRGSLALSNTAIVAADAAALYLCVIEMNIGTERNRVMAGRAVVRRLDMRCDLRCCIKH